MQSRMFTARIGHTSQGWRWVSPEGWASPTRGVCHSLMCMGRPREWTSATWKMPLLNREHQPHLVHKTTSFSRSATFTTITHNHNININNTNTNTRHRPLHLLQLQRGMVVAAAMLLVVPLLHRHQQQSVLIWMGIPIWPAEEQHLPSSRRLTTIAGERTIYPGSVSTSDPSPSRASGSCCRRI